MSITDETMWDYFLMLTDLELKEINKYKSSVEKDKDNPFTFKKLLGEIVISELFNKEEAIKAAKSFDNITINKNIPDEIKEISITNDIDLHIPKFLVENGLLKSSSEGRRLISSGAFKINDTKYENLDINSNELINKTIQLGKRKYFRIIQK
tara:strand:- start:82 stop:537 length:456 start_codon:yes stop_codon:yes gene_type:complete